MTFQQTVFERGTVSSIVTFMPSSKSVSVWAWNFFEKGISLPYLGCLRYSVTLMVTVPCIFVEVITPDLVLTILFWFKWSKVTSDRTACYSQFMNLLEFSESMFHLEWEEIASKSFEVARFFLYFFFWWSCFSWLFWCRWFFGWHSWKKFNWFNSFNWFYLFGMKVLLYYLILKFDVFTLRVREVKCYRW